MKPVNLTVHRNTLERRKERNISSAMLRNAKRAAACKDVAGFALVTWDRGFNHRVAWDTGGTMPGNVMPEYVKRALERVQNKDDAHDEIFGPFD